MPRQQTSLRDKLYLTQDQDETTFKYDNQLPSLPVPTVKQSVFKLLDTIKPIVDEDSTQAFKEVEKKALALLQDANVTEIQKLLERRASERKNWLEEWWLEFAYLRSRKPLIPYSNMAAPLPIMQYWPLLSPGSQGYEGARARRAALSTFFQLSFWTMLRNEQMRPMIHKGVPWSMNQFRYLFNTCRRPGEPKDELVSWFRTAKEAPPESLEIIVLYRGYIHAIKPVTMVGPKQACILSAPQIEHQLRHIEDWCRSRLERGPGIGALTTNERSVWKEARDELMSISEHNRQLVDRIERALSVLVLDDHEPTDAQEIFELSMMGEASDRWADKSITSIAFKNGTFGANADHTPYDGFCTGIMTHYLMTSVEECSGQWGDELGIAANSSWASYSEPELLEFKLSPQIKVSLHETHTHFQKVCSTIDVLHETFDHYGKAILKEHRFHPEAFVQCAIHATYHRQHGKMAPAYVTASTRRFHNGRTETCRSCYPEMMDFAKFINNPESNWDTKQTYLLLKRSVERFQQLMNEASNGHGCDRHLMGLYLVALFEGKKVPELFDDELVQRTNNYVLSTSCAGYWNVCGGVPPLVEDGYGCFYGIEDNAITFGLTGYKTSKETNIRLFHKNLTNVLLEMQRVLLNTKL